MYLNRMSMEDFKEEISKGKIVLLPYGVAEEHGPHLPLGTDTIQIEKIIESAHSKRDFIVAPTVNYGLCSSTRNFPGTITISFNILENLTYELLCELDRNEVSKAIIISGHAGSDHMTALRVAAKRFARESSMMVIATSIADLVLINQNDELLKSFPPGDKHAGFVETSLMMYIENGIVKKDNLPPPSNPKFPDPLIIANAETYFPSGIMGDPTNASSQKGKEIFETAVESLIKLIDWFEKEIS
ncbi:MAG: creatininase family protein [Candidatus Schekmanbacteria bacterium]|nr:MAG: creatininase family protein [Candidatus Schekmanbacteria bacterium]